MHIHCLHVAYPPSPSHFLQLKFDSESVHPAIAPLNRRGTSCIREPQRLHWELLVPVFSWSIIWRCVLSGRSPSSKGRRFISSRARFSAATAAEDRRMCGTGTLYSARGERAEEQAGTVNAWRNRGWKRGPETGDGCDINVRSRGMRTSARDGANTESATAITPDMMETFRKCFTKYYKRVVWW